MSDLAQKAAASCPAPRRWRRWTVFGLGFFALKGLVWLTLAAIAWSAR